MIKRIVILLILSVSLTLMPAQASLLWKVSGNGLEQPSYVFGTVHVICPADFYMDERIESAFASTEALMLELDISSPHTMAELQQHMVNPSGPYLENYLNADQFRQVDTFFSENFGAGLAFIGGLKPFVLNSMAVMAAIPCNEPVSYEGFFIEQAQASELPIKELETATFQATMFDSVPVAEQVGWLYEMINEFDEAEKMLTRLMDAYLSEDMDVLLTVMFEDDSYDEYMALLLDDRNVNWVQPISAQMQKASTFIAVGAGHLPGELGVVNLLQQAGFKVEPVRRGE